MPYDGQPRPTITVINRVYVAPEMQESVGGLSPYERRKALADGLSVSECHDLYRMGDEPFSFDA